MKTAQDWGFISKEQTAVKPKLQDNKIFHALTSAYENNQQNEIYSATENIIRREKEMCEMALADLKKLSGGKKDQDETLKLVVDHYQTRLEVAKEKEEKINLLSEDSRKMMEEYKKRTQELAEVKRTMMESQSKLRELAKTTERLIKKEEELRFIELNLRTELDNNKRNIINGLYEIVHDFSEQAPEPIPEVTSEPVTELKQELIHEPNLELVFNAEPKSEPKTEPKAAETIAPIAEKPAEVKPEPQVKPQSRMFNEGLFQTNPPTQLSGTFLPTAQPAAKPTFQPLSRDKDQDLISKTARLKMFEPGKSMVNKSMVKTADGEVISEYFYSPLHPKEGRHYIFNSLFAVANLLGLKTNNNGAFHERVKTVFTDLLNRLNNGQNIHLESFLSEEINNAVLSKLIDAKPEHLNELFDAVVVKLLNRIESIGPGRAGLIDNQFRQMPKSDFSLRAGLSA